MENINLIYIGILINIITLLLFVNSSVHDKYLLFVMIIGQLILISGESNKNFQKIQISHIFFTISVIIGSIYFKDKHNLYFLIVIISTRFITRYIYGDCLFNLSNQNYEFEFENKFEFINWDIIFTITFMIIFFRLLKDKIIK